jgi:hypothetical protein
MAFVQMEKGMKKLTYKDIERGGQNKMGKKKKPVYEIDKQKDTYRLWAEYLKEVFSYRLCCDLIKQRVSKEKAIENLRLCGKRRSSRQANTKLIEAILEMWNEIYFHFGDVFSKNFNFDQLWEGHLSKELERYDSRNGVRLLDDEWLEYLAKKWAENITKRCNEEKRPITAKDIEQEVLSLRPNKWFAFMSVQNYRSKGYLIKRFDETITELKKRNKITEYDEMIETNSYNRPTPVKRRLVGELQKYLDVYRMRKQTPQPTWKTIIETLGAKFPGEKGDYTENNRRLFLGYYQKAKQIIKNVNEHIFPGDY